MLDLPVPDLPDDLVLEPYGPVASVQEFRLPVGLDGVEVCTAEFASGLTSPDGLRLDNGSAGYGANRELARCLAKIEAMERFANFSWDPTAVVDATALELGSRALDLSSVPQHSSTELASGGAGRPDPKSRIRWTEATEFTSGTRRLVPTVMAYLGLVPRPGEAFWHQISTGTAAHQTAELAALSGLLESIERDVVQVVWEQSLPLPRLDPSCFPLVAKSFMESAALSGLGLHLFDGTSEFGAPTIVGVLTDEATTTSARVLGCGTSATVDSAITKCLRELVSTYTVISHSGEAPRDGEDNDHHHLLDAAIHLAQREYRSAFDFLLNDLNRRPMSCPTDVPGESPEAQLDHLVDAFRQRDMPVYVVDLGNAVTDTLGLQVAHVLCPDLQPMTPMVGPRYRGHRRLYTAPAIWGYPVRTEEELNPHCIPFG